MSEVLQPLPDIPGVWRGRGGGSVWRTLPSGHSRLDALLGGGWPAARLTEIAVERWGCGELALVMPLLARLCREGRNGGRCGWLAWIAPPFLPYAPALAAAGVDLKRLLVVREQDDGEVLWATEQALRSGACRVVLAWVQRASSRQLRRLQLAAEHGETPVFLFRSPDALVTPSPAALRLKLACEAGDIRLHLLKHRAGAPRSLPADAFRPATRSVPAERS